MKSFFKKIGAAGISIVLASTSLFSIPVFAEDSSTNPKKAVATDTSHYDLAKLLQYSMTFYDANMCGTDVSGKSLFSWRGNCHTYDEKVPLQPMDSDENGTNLSQSFIDANKAYLDPDGDGYVNVQGGLHDAGDHVEFGMPENYTAATLGWGYYEFKDSYTKLGLDSHIETILRHVNDYLMRCTFLDDSDNVVAFCYQVGDGDIDHAVWESPEADIMARPAYFLTADKPQVDYTSSAAASLLINYLNFKDSDPEYAAKSLKIAKALFKFTDEAIAAKGADNVLSDNADGPKQYYASSKWQDDYVWASAWMFEVTQDKSYLDNAEKYMDYYAPSGWCYCWNDMWSGAVTMWAIIQQQHPEFDLATDYRTAVDKSPYEEIDWWKSVEKAINTWENNYTTPAGYMFMSVWGSARYDTAAQFICLIHDKYTNNNKPGDASKWAMGQMNYLLGDNPIERCYVCGYSENSVQYPHHRAASGLISAEDTRKQKHVLYGALVGGPDGQDKHNDITSDYTYNEVTIDYNAAFVGAAAGLYAFFGTDDMAVTKDFPPADAVDPGDNTGSGYWVEACGVDDLHSDGAGITKVSFKVMTGSSDAKTDISVRYYFNSSEISNISSVESKELYDQANAEVTLKDGSKADGQISKPIKYDKLDNTYYVEISFPGYAVANSGKKYQFSLGMYYGDKWDPSNDWSYDGLAIKTDTAFFENGAEEKTDKICVYSNGVLIGGTEPDGTKASEDTKTTTTTSPKQTTTTTTKATTTVSKTETKSTTTSSKATTATTATSSKTTTDITSTSDENILWGDANLDKEVNIADAVYLNRYIAGSVEISDSAKKNVDLYQAVASETGVINSNDSEYEMKYLVNSVSKNDFPIRK